ncbi:MAG TPA: hypothetical protein VEF34_00470 [Syntrophobacteraceae bacterium]|nr:hypothetical protein [Syntrophobacteraceae bacterium]
MTRSSSSDVASYHFTYCMPTEGDLQQGDILSKGDRLKALIGQIHPHYLKDDYTHFIVLTQSCDLARRGGQSCMAEYISIAAIRPLFLVLEREIAKYQDEFSKRAGVCKKQIRFRLEQFLERLFNNNHEEYFYLHEQLDMDFPTSSCAFLRLSIALKVDNYDLCLQSRILSLTDIFQAKLGWMVGNIYSRIGTDEWVPTACTKTEFSENINKLLDSACEWVDEKKLNEAKGKITVTDDTTQEVLKQQIRDTKIPSKKDQAINCFLSESEKLIEDPNILKKLKNRLINNPELAILLK